MAGEKFLDEPDAADAGETLDIKGELGRGGGGRAALLGGEGGAFQPGEVAGLEDEGLHGGEVGVAEVVEAVEVFRLDEFGDKLAARAAEAVGGTERSESGAAVGAGNVHDV